LVEGMQEEEHDHEHEEDDHDEDHAHEHEEGETEYDEHIWLSLKNATVLVSSISDAIRTIDPDNAESYKKNASAYIEKLNALDAKYRAAVDSAAVKTVLFGDRFPFRYLTDDYGLTYYAAFVGCSAETEASFETITFLSQKVDELSLPAVLTIEGKDHRIAETIVRNTKTKDQIILTMDSMQGTTAKDVRNGVTYLSIMEKNLEVLENAIH
ncbi:MAG: zinc ABC transporter substrate-binding protein, partial [Clostridia bacterium]|nr:zinc ABC transporter substrate-binding protein [Clostridia bacterium]